MTPEEVAASYGEAYGADEDGADDGNPSLSNWCDTWDVWFF